MKGFANKDTPGVQPSSETTSARSVRPFRSSPELRYETNPGEMAQCDWSACLASHPDGSERNVNCFTMTLSYSRMRFIEFTPSQDLPTFLTCHLHAFEYYGGVLGRPL
ncbi:MAG: hypothetical protein RQM90_08305 [Methanoculleus sp.]